MVLGAPDADSAELYAETVVNGDPSWAGPLAGVAMNLPVFHIMEPELKVQIDPKVKSILAYGDARSEQDYGWTKQGSKEPKE